jgi:hypothetical protein
MLLFRSTLHNTAKLSTRFPSRTFTTPHILRAFATMATDPTKYKLNHSM